MECRCEALALVVANGWAPKVVVVDVRIHNDTNDSIVFLRWPDTCTIGEALQISDPDIEVPILFSTWDEEDGAECSGEEKHPCSMSLREALEWGKSQCPSEPSGFCLSGNVSSPYFAVSCWRDDD